MKLEYIILIILAIGFYESSIKEARKLRKNKEFINDNLDIGSKIRTKSGIIGQVIELEKDRVVIISGNYQNNSNLTIDKNEIEHIIG